MQGGLFDYALQTTYGTASYEDWYGSSASRMVSGQKRLPGSGGSDGSGDDSPFGWLAWLAKHASSYGTYGDNSYGFDVYQLRSAYEAWLLEWMAETGLTEDKAPSFDDFLNWFYEKNFTYNWNDGNGNNSTSLHWVPVGSILPLLIMALMYVVYLVVRRRKSLAEQA
jgi:hypothetical protein